MADARKKAVANYRQRARRAGLARLEVKVRKEDVPLVREIVQALTDPKSGPETRALLRKSIPGKTRSLKTLLASAPLEGIDLSRGRDVGRDVDL